MDGSLEGRDPPHSLEAERSVLGAVLNDERALGEAAFILREEDFHKEAHRKIFAAMKALQMRDAPIDPVTLSDELRAMAALEAVGGAAYLITLENSVPHAANVQHYARIVAENATRRRLIAASHASITDAYGDDPVEEVVSRAQQRVMEIAFGQKRDATAPAREAVKEAFQLLERLQEHQGEVTGVPTGFVDLDRMTSGLHKGELVIVAARPSVGKTSLVLNIAAHVALRAEKPVIMFSLEMPKVQLVMRLLSSEARIDAQRLRIGRLHDHEWTRLAEQGGRLARSDLWLNDAASLTAFDMRVACRQVQARLGPDKPLALVIVDYLQLMRPSGRTDSREQAIAEISRSLKAMAKELDVPVIALSQLSRKVEGREDKRPQLSDLRESGSIEQDADVVLFIHREEMYDRDSAEKGTAELIIGKQRNGPTGSVKLAFLHELTRFDNLAHEQEEEAYG